MGGSRWWERQVLVTVVLLAGLGMTSVVIAAFKVTNAWVVGGSAVGVAVVAAVSGVWQERYKRIKTRHDETAMKLQDGCLIMADGRLPKVSQVDDPIRLGVHPAIVLADDTGQNAQAPAYVPRDVDAELHERLASGGFVLLVGDSTAGKSRTAFEAMRATLPNHLLIAPHDRAALPAAIERAVRAKRAIVWLSDLEHYLGTGGLTREHIARITGGSGHHRVILATLRSAEQARLTSEPSDGDYAVRLAVREVRETLEQAHSIRLARMLTAEELQRARVRDWDARISSALQHIEEFGLAEYLASGPELQRDYDNAWDVGVNPRGAALISAAIDCRRAGFGTLIPKALLEELHENYLHSRGGHRLSLETLEAAWRWATRPRRATTGLLSPTVQGSAVKVFDYLVDAKQRAEGPFSKVDDHTILVAIHHATVDDASGLANNASRQGRYHLAEKAWFHTVNIQKQALGAEHPSTLVSRSNWASAIWECGRYQESEIELRMVLQAMQSVLGEHHPTTLTTRYRLAMAVLYLMRTEEAEVEFLLIVSARRRLLGAEHPDTLDSWGSWAISLADLGRFTEAEVEFRSLLTVQRRILGWDSPNALTCQDNLALVLRQLGRPGEAEIEFRAVLDAHRKLHGKEHPRTLLSASHLGSALNDLGRYEEAETLHREVLDGRRRILGEEHTHTLMSRNNLAVALMGLGRLEEAEAEHRDVLEEWRRLRGEEYWHTLICRNNLAVVLSRLGRLEEAEAEHREVLQIRRRVLGEVHPDTLKSRSKLADVLWRLGRLEEAAVESRAALEGCRSVLGEEHPDTLEIRATLVSVLGALGRLEETEALE